MPIYYDHSEDAFYLHGFKDGYDSALGEDRKDEIEKLIIKMLDNNIDNNVIMNVLEIPLTYVKAVQQGIKFKLL